MTQGQTALSHALDRSATATSGYIIKALLAGRRDGLMPKATANSSGGASGVRRLECRLSEARHLPVGQSDRAAFAGALVPAKRREEGYTEAARRLPYRSPGNAWALEFQSGQGLGPEGILP